MFIVPIFIDISMVKTLYSNTQCTMSNNNFTMKFNMQQKPITSKSVSSYSSLPNTEPF